MLVIGNWKLHGSKADNATHVQAMVKNLKADLKNELVICPPFVYLQQVAELIQDHPQLSLGAQNISDQTQGAFTGEVSAQMLCDMACRYVLVGHMERRLLYGESNAMIAQKYKLALEHGLQAVLCVGETLEEHEQGIAKQVIAEQLRQGIQAVEDQSLLLAPLVAYEPGWAIGTGRHATAQEIFETHQFINELMVSIIAGCAPRVLYGGSVKPDNTKELFNIQYVNGVLVGGASLQANDFVSICHNTGK